MPPRTPRNAAPDNAAVSVYPVEGRFLPGVPHAADLVSVDRAAELVATGAFSLEPQTQPVVTTHVPECNDQCDPATGAHYLVGDSADAEASSQDAADAGSEPPGEEPAPSDETASQPDGPADDAGPSDTQE